MREEYWVNCKQEGCDKPVAVLVAGLCMSHYHMRLMSMKEGTCSLEWCERRLYAKNLCNTHYQRQLDGLPFRDPRIPKPECSFDGCNNEVTGKQDLCKTHYAQRYRGQELRPIRAWRTETVGELRKCNNCEQWKPVEESYYKTTRGSWQGECKSCMVKRNGANNLRRKLEKEGVSV